ncbi:MAG: hypothetical protein HC809_11930 [Gammaproteobacteria bacterium]|nr:hypothetical protein [Gammaproteobacteria bacterium]
MDEFSLIDALVAKLGDATRGEFVVLGPGDDAALTRSLPGEQVATTVDTLVAGTHFPNECAGHLVGRRALGVSVSDLAAMGARRATLWSVSRWARRMKPGCSTSHAVSRPQLGAWVWRSSAAISREVRATFQLPQSVSSRRVRHCCVRVRALAMPYSSVASLVVQGSR